VRTPLAEKGRRKKDADRIKCHVSCWNFRAYFLFSLHLHHRSGPWSSASGVKFAVRASTSLAATVRPGTQPSGTRYAVAYCTPLPRLSMCAAACAPDPRRPSRPTTAGRGAVYSPRREPGSPRGDCYEARQAHGHHWRTPPQGLCRARGTPHAG
jgi:hypothetical protein